MSIIEKYSDFEDSLIGKDLKSYQEINKFQEYFDGIARYIFGNVAITTGKDKQKIKYYLEEIVY